MKVTSLLVEAHVFRYNKNSSDLEFLVMKRSPNEKYAGIWQMVTGRIEQNEKAYQTAVREIKEETGLVPKQFWVVPNVNSFYAHESDVICMVPVFAALVENEDVVISDEHDEYKWLGKEDAKMLLAWEGQRTSVDAIHKYFTKEKSFLNFIEIKL